jgi:hypothetical protein
MILDYIRGHMLLDAKILAAVISILIVLAMGSFTFISIPVMAAPLSNVSAMSTNNILNTKSYYDIVFTTTTTKAIKTIDVVFPSGFILSNAMPIENKGIGFGTVSASGGTLRYIVNSPITVSGGTNIRLEFANVGNPATPLGCCNVVVQTRDTTGGVIDGPTTSAVFTLKQIVIPHLQVTERTSTIVNIPPQSFSFETIVQCNPDEQVTGGGFSAGGPSEVDWNAANGNAWDVTIFNPNFGPEGFIVHANCAKLVP